MKKLVVLASAVLAFAACSETLEVNQGNSIFFRTSVATKAVELTTATLTRFDVSAFTAADAEYFNNVAYTRDDATSTYTTTNVQFWPKTGTLSFYAWANNDSGTVSMATGSKKLTGYVSADGTAQTDFVTANATGDAEHNTTSGVSLTFKHRLSQVVVKAKSSSSNITYKVEGVKFANVKSAGSFDFTTNTWALDNSKKDFVSTLAVPVTLAAEAQLITEPFMLLPQQLVKWVLPGDKPNAAHNSFLAVKVNIQKTEGAVQIFPETIDAYGYACLPIDTEWVAGKKYTYVLDFTNGPGVDEGGEPILNVIKFNVEVEDWDVEEDINLGME